MAHAKIYLGLITRVLVVVSGVSTCLQAAGSGDTQGVWPELVESSSLGIFQISPFLGRNGAGGGAARLHQRKSN